MDDILKKNKRAKIILLCIIIIAAAAVILFAFFPRTERDTEKMTVYYRLDGDPEMYMAILRGKDAEKMKTFFASFKYDRDDPIKNIDNEDYEIRGEHKGSSNIDYNYFVYIRDKYYIVFNPDVGYDAKLVGENYDTLKEFLSESNLRSLESGPDYS